jgi:hypothetical protein
MSSTHRHLLLYFFWQVISGPPCIFFFIVDDNICDHFLNHNHPPDVQKLSRQTVNNVCKRKAVDDICERPSKIMNREVSNSVYKESLTTRDLELIRHNINRNRLNTMPATPKNIAEVHEAISSMNIVTDRKERFLLLNDIISSLFNEFVCNLGFFWHEWASLKLE